MKLLRTLLVVLAFSLSVFAAKQNASKPVAQKPAAVSAQDGFKTEFFANLDDAEDKILHLAESIPAEKYNWRPAPDVRSISEVFMHIAGGNYFLSTFLDVEAPKRDGDIETTITKKADVLAELKRSFEHLRNAARKTNDLEKPVKMFGTQTTRRGVLVTILSHLHEHLGQSIAYARINGVVPPWSH